MIIYDNKAWCKHIFVCKGTVLKGTLSRVIIFTIWTAFIDCLFWLVPLSGKFQIDMAVFNIIGLALGLLLVFRTNTSYDRWWEGRRFLGSNVNASRNVAFYLNDIIDERDKDSREEIVELISAFQYALKERLREGVQPEHLPMLRKEFKDIVFNTDHIPNSIIKILRSKINALRSVNKEKHAEFLALYNELSILINNAGGMERIRFTPVPFAYAAHLQLFMMIYFFALPLGLFEKFGWISIPVMSFITLIMIGINEIGVEIEDPFGNDPNDLPVEDICSNIRKNITEILLH